MNSITKKTKEHKVYNISHSLVWGNRIKWIILKYFSFLLFGSSNRMNENFILLFVNLSRRE